MTGTSRNLVQSRRALARQSKAAAVVFGLGFALYSLAQGALGETFFATTISVLLALSELGLAPSEIVHRVRVVFMHGDAMARKLVLVVALGGSAWVIDAVYGLDILPEGLDVWVKRLGPALQLVALYAYVASVVSNRLYVLGEIEEDRSLRAYEFPYYFLTLCACGITAVLFLGLPLEEMIGSSQDQVAIAFVWGGDVLKLLGAMLAVTNIWLIALLACLVSRYLEWSWCIRLKPADGPAPRPMARDLPRKSHQ
jgi:hypothetical protein